MKILHLKTLVSLLLLSLLITVGVTAQTPQPPTPVPGNPLVLDLDGLPPGPLVSQDVLAPGCELTSAEAGVFQVVCESDPGTSGIPTIDGELVTQGCELESPEAGVFILNCETEPFEPVPMSPAPLTIQPGSIGGGTPTDFAPEPDACDGAAESYLEPGMEVVSNLLISLDSVVYNNQDEDLALYALHAIEANVWRENVLRQFAISGTDTLSSPVDEAIQFGDVFTLGAESTCIAADDMTLRLWRLEPSFGEEFGYWVIETIAFNNPIDLTATWPEDIPDPQNVGMQLAQPQFPILVDGVVFRYLMPYMEGPTTTLPGAGGVTSDLPADTTACEFAAPSFVAVGMTVLVDNYGYERRAGVIPGELRDFETWTLLDSQTELTNHGTAVNQDILENTPLTGIPGNLESVAAPPSEMTVGIKVGTVIDGPFCSSVNAEPGVVVGDITEAPDPDAERFYTWWQVDFGGGQFGWYPENVGQYSFWVEQPRKLFLYYMVPFNAMVQPECPAPGLFAGQAVQPAAGAMNLRAAPNGDVIGRVDAGQAITVFDAPTCSGGINWWPTDRGGFIAENDPESGLPLLVQYVPPTVAPPTTAPVQPQPLVTEVPAQPAPVVTEPPREPQPPAEQPPREPQRPTEEPPRSSPVTIAPIIAEPVNPTRPPR